MGAQERIGRQKSCIIEERRKVEVKIDISQGNKDSQMNLLLRGFAALLGKHDG